jgi:hypothetical protein
MILEDVTPLSLVMVTNVSEGHTQVKVKVMLRQTISQSVYRDVKFTLEPVTRCYILSERCCVVSVGRPL